MGEMDGKVAIVTGAGRMRGIGRATAVALAREGCDVVVTGTGRDPAIFPDEERQAGWRDIESTADQVRAKGGRCLPLVVDVSKSDQVQAMVEAAMRTFGRVDILINNAAFARGPDHVPVLEMDEAIFRRVLEVKAVGAFLCSRAVLSPMIERGEGGSICNISSTAGLRGHPRTSAYCAANFALHGFSQALAFEVARHNIRVNVVCPGMVDTFRVTDLSRSERQERAANTIPLKRLATDEELAEMLVFLCSPRASYITAQTIAVNGGLWPT